MTTKKDLIDKIESYCEERGLSVSDVNPYLEKLYRLSKPNLEQMIPNYEERQQENDEDIDKANIKIDYYQEKNCRCSTYVELNNRPWGAVDARICKGCVHYTGRNAPYQCNKLTKEKEFRAKNPHIQKRIKLTKDIQTDESKGQDD